MILYEAKMSDNGTNIRLDKNIIYVNVIIIPELSYYGMILTVTVKKVEKQIFDATKAGYF